LEKRKTAENDMLGTFRKTRALWQELNCPKSSPNHVDCRTTGKRLAPGIPSTLFSMRRSAYPSDGIGTTNGVGTDERTAYGVLDTYVTDGKRDALRAAKPRGTELS